MNKVIPIVIVLIAIGIGIVSYSQISQEEGLETEIAQDEIEEISEIDIFQAKPKSYSVGLNEQVGLTEP